MLYLNATNDDRRPSGLDNLHLTDFNISRIKYGKA